MNVHCEDVDSARRGFLAGVTTFAIACAVSPLVRATASLARSGDVKRWLDHVASLCATVQSGKMTTLQWKQHLDDLNRATPLVEMLPELQFDRALAAMQRDGKDPRKTFIRLADIDGSYRRASFAAAYFVFAKGQVITPHGHRGMVSAHAVVAGQLRVRTFDRVADEPDALLIRPRLDQPATPGFTAAISASEGNVHWFVAERDRSATLDVIVDDLDAHGGTYRIDLIDPDSATTTASGALRAPLISWQESSRRYQA